MGSDFFDGDMMEIGDTGFVSTSDGWMVNPHTGYTRDPEGRVYDEDGELIFDPYDDEDYDDEEDDEYIYWT